MEVTNHFHGNTVADTKVIWTLARENFNATEK